MSLEHILGPVGRFIQSSIKYAENGFSNVSNEDYHKRLLICGQCEFFNNHFCSKCSCFLPLKARMATENCPLDKWSDIENISENKIEVRPCGGCS